VPIAIAASSLLYIPSRATAARLKRDNRCFGSLGLHPVTGRAQGKPNSIAVIETQK
jgi:hypothetical protein